VKRTRPFTVMFVQCQEKRQLPHMNMPLFVPDLERAGCRVACVCLSQHRLDRLAGLLSEQRVDLLAMEHMAPYGVVRRVREASPHTRIVVGGNGFIDVFTKTDVDFGVVGAGRESLRRLVAALRGDGDLSRVPNLLFKRRDHGRDSIECSEVEVGLDPAAEVRPYAPELDWRYVGFGGDLPPLARRGAPPTIVTDFGCACRAGSSPAAPAGFSLSSASYLLSAAARARLARVEAQRSAGGCRFCTYGGYAIAPVNATVELALEQMSYLQERYGFDRFAIGSEEPFRFVLPLLRRALAAGITLRQVLLRCRVDWLLRFRGVLEESIRLARDTRFQLGIWQVGFESFSDRHLELYGKEQTVADNLEAIRLLDDLERRWEGWFATSVRSHGFLGSTPWTTVADLDEQLGVISGLPHRWRPALLGGPVKLFDELLPFSRQLEADGLLVRRAAGRNRFRFQDDRVRVYEQVRATFSRRCRPLADGFFRRVALDAYLEVARALVAELSTADASLALHERRRALARGVAATEARMRPILAASRAYSRAGALEASGSYLQALEGYRHAHRLLPGHGAILAAMSRAAHAHGRLGWARRYARLAIPPLEAEQERHPHEPAIDLLLAQCLARVGDRGRAAQHLGRGAAKRRAVLVGGD